jgi:hypothetical protein
MGESFQKLITNDFQNGNLGPFSKYINAECSDVDLKLAALKYLHHKTRTDRSFVYESGKLPSKVVDAVNVFVQTYPIFREYSKEKRKTIGRQLLTRAYIQELKIEWEELLSEKGIENPTDFAKHLSTLVDIYEVKIEGSEKSLEMIK